jgi:hypothetical protein
MSYCLVSSVHCLLLRLDLALYILTVGIVSIRDAGRKLMVTRLRQRERERETPYPAAYRTTGRANGATCNTLRGREDAVGTCTSSLADKGNALPACLPGLSFPDWWREVSCVVPFQRRLSSCVWGDMHGYLCCSVIGSWRAEQAGLASCWEKTTTRVVITPLVAAATPHSFASADKHCAASSESCHRRDLYTSPCRLTQLGRRPSRDVEELHFTIRRALSLSAVAADMHDAR